ncbi:SEN34 [Candida oxycetoniae]|uniref:tRNA-splicing endonuclease subunit Sen34 n=1 Tax=Candida oxycetoniae TaxID=497107 RepID=A0AAI9WYW0_9ASCO|nr:SEN34 [Candida oxycetoniae]KAI3405722.2 SEN34 [Candida oxycetoniae]
MEDAITTAALTVVSGEGKKCEKIQLPVVSPNYNPEVLLFNLDDIKKLRNNYHILGLLIGTLPQFPQQNLFLSVPLKLNVWETLWLLKHDVAVLIDQLSYRSAKSRKIMAEQNKSNNIVDSMITTPNTDIDRDYELAKSFEIDVKQYLQAYLKNPASRMPLAKLIRDFKYYDFLQKQGFYINPGLRFGGDLVLYPGDPLRFHSYSIVKFEFADMYDIITGGRLATAVKKNMIIMGFREKRGKQGESKDRVGESADTVVVDDAFIEELFEDEVPLCFSIEWAGFG